MVSTRSSSSSVKKDDKKKKITKEKKERKEQKPSPPFNDDNLIDKEPSHSSGTGFSTPGDGLKVGLHPNLGSIETHDSDEIQ